MSNWKPIETAPKDGTRIICANESEIAIAEWSGSVWISEKQADGTWGGWLVSDCRSDSISIHPTHWMELPELPK